MIALSSYYIRKGIVPAHCHYHSSSMKFFQVSWSVVGESLMYILVRESIVRVGSGASDSTSINLFTNNLRQLLLSDDYTSIIERVPPEILISKLTREQLLFTLFLFFNLS